MPKAFPTLPIPTTPATRINNPALTGPPYQLVRSVPLMASNSLAFPAAIPFRSGRYSQGIASNPSAFKGRSTRMFRLRRRYPAAPTRPSRSPICKFRSPSTPIWILSSVCQTGQHASTLPHVLPVALQSRTVNAVAPSLCHSKCRLMVVTVAVILAFIA
jgi:hypothetical protein